MKNLFLAFIVCISIVGCGGETDFGENSGTIKKVKDLLVDKFGEGAFYTSIRINQTDHGSIVSATVTEDPSSLKMEEWNHFQGKWDQTSEVTLEISGGAKAEDFMYVLNKDLISFDLLGKLVDQSKEKLNKEKNIDAVTDLIMINAPKDGDFSTMKYYINLKPRSGGTTFTFSYNMDGTLDDFDY